MTPAVLESFVVTEFLKQRFNRMKPSNLYYWRDSVGHEIDLLLDFGTVQLPIEIKSGQTVNDDFFKNLNFYRKINPACQKAVLVYGGENSYVQKDNLILSFRDLPLLSTLDHELRFPG